MFGMTPSESRVAAALGTGQTALQIGGQLGISENTVRTHIRGVLYKLGAARLNDAVRVLRQGEALWSLAGEPFL
jgi:DNA-binding CsgD family transcriptional regulator